MSACARPTTAATSRSSGRTFVETSWHRICAKDLTIVGSWGFTGNDIPLAIEMLDRAAERYPWDTLQATYPLTEPGVARAVEDAMALRCLKATICP